MAMKARSLAIGLGAIGLGAIVAGSAGEKGDPPFRAQGIDDVAPYLSSQKGPPWGALAEEFLSRAFPDGTVNFSGDLYTAAMTSPGGFSKERLHRPTAAVVPHGRSLARHETTKEFPRIVLALPPLPGPLRNTDRFDTWNFAGKPRPGDTVFVGYSPRVHQLEIIAPNRKGNGNGGYADFFLIKDFAPGRKPTLQYSPPGACEACHEDGKLLFSEFPWLEFHDAKPGDNPLAFGKLPNEALLHPSLVATIDEMKASGVTFNFREFDDIVRLASIQNDVHGSSGNRSSFLDDRGPDIHAPNKFSVDLDPLFQTSRGQLEDTNAISALACRGWQGPAKERGENGDAKTVFDAKCGGCHDGSHGPPAIFFGVAKYYVGSANASRSAATLVSAGIMPPIGAPPLEASEAATLMQHLCSDD